MKVLIRFVLFFTVGTLSILIAKEIQNKEIKRAESSEKLKMMPKFKYTPVSNIGINDSPVNKPTTIINYFNSHCSFCIYEIKEILECQHLFNKTQFLLVSDQPFDTLNKFSKINGIDSMSSITIGQIDFMDFINHFGEVIPPTTFIYDSNNYFISKYYGQIRVMLMAEEIEKHYNKIEQQ
jgi:hypothetical protein